MNSDIYTDIHNTINSLQKSVSCYEIESSNNKLITQTQTPITKIQNDENQISKEQKRETEKLNILKEIVSTEKKYLNDLREIIEGYYNGLLNLDIVNTDLLSQIFFNIKDILAFTESFCESLDECNYDAASIAQCFITKNRLLYKLYSPYSQNYHKALLAVNELEKNRNAAKFIEKTREHFRHSFRLASCLHLPIGRITKYHLFLQRYLKLLADRNDSALYPLMSDALNLMKKVADDMQVLIPDNVAINKTLSNSSTKQLKEVYGDVLKEGDLFMVETKKLHHVILFENIFVIKESSSNSKVFHSIANESLQFFPKSFKHEFSQKHFTVMDYSQSKAGFMSTFTFKAKSAEEKQTWRSPILASIIKSYGKKISDNDKSKMIHIEDFGSQTDLKEKSKSNQNGGRKSISDFRSNFMKAITGHSKAPGAKIIDERRQSMPIEPVVWSQDFEYPREIRKSIGNINDLRNSVLRNMLQERKASSLPNDQARRQQMIEKRYTTCFETFTNDLEVIEEQENNNNNNNNSNCIINDNKNANYDASEESSDTSGGDTASLHSKISSYIDDLDLDKYFNQGARSSSSNSSSLVNKSQSSSSLNSEEGYYSHHDSSVCTLVDDSCNQIIITEPLTKLTKSRTKSTPDIFNLKHFSTFDMSKLELTNEINIEPLDKDNQQSATVTATTPQPSVTKIVTHPLNEFISQSTLNLTTKPEQRQAVTVNKHCRDAKSLPVDLKPSKSFNYQRSTSQYAINLIHCQPDSSAYLQRRSNVYMNSDANELRNKFVKFHCKIDTQINEEETPEEFLLLDAFGLKFLLEAEHFFAPGVRELITKFERRKFSEPMCLSLPKI